jgi:alpha-L-fucosidase
MKTNKYFLTISMLCLTLLLCAQTKKTQNMDEMWGEQALKLNTTNAQRGQLFLQGNYAMFIHWGLFSKIAGEWKGKTYYGISEWIMHRNMANIPIDEYKEVAKTFIPTKFNAMEIAQLAKDAGMKYIVITSKHHDGFAMYHSKANKFNIVDATPYGRDPMKELADACKSQGIGFGFYYSHNQDWTYPGGTGGPTKDSIGNAKTFDDYFVEKCLPQVKEITTEYGDIELVWFDTPGNMPKEYAQQLVELVHRNQPKALVSGRVGYNMGDYRTLGDMEVPDENVDGLWEAVDVTNDSWGFARYDENWKTPKEILCNLISTIARGGTYMMNIGPDPDGIVPAKAAKSLRKAGDWIKKYPQVIYNSDPSPWKHKMPFGDIVAKGNKLFLAVYAWPANGKIMLPGLKSNIVSLKLLSNNTSLKLSYKKTGNWTALELPISAPEKLISVIEITLNEKAIVDQTQGIDPHQTTILSSTFATVENCEKATKKWMEKFGEWKTIMQISKWMPNAKATWTVDIAQAGDYIVGLNTAGDGKLVWSVETDEGAIIKNQQPSTSLYATRPVGWITFHSSGKHTITVKLVEGKPEISSLSAIELIQVEM